MFKNKYRKALTFSFDDGVNDDIRLVELLNRYSLKSTFNLNSGMLSNRRNHWVFKDVKPVRNLYYSEAPNLYEGHEIASHTVNHLEPCEISPITFYNELFLDKTYLQALYKTEIKGMAFPYGTSLYVKIGFSSFFITSTELYIFLKNFLYCFTRFSLLRFFAATNIIASNPTARITTADNIIIHVV